MEGWEFRPLRYILQLPLSVCLLDYIQGLSMDSYVWMWDERGGDVMVSSSRDEDWRMSYFIRFLTIMLWYILTKLVSLEISHLAMVCLVGGSEYPNRVLNDALIQRRRWSDFGPLLNVRYLSACWYGNGRGGPYAINEFIFGVGTSCERSWYPVSLQEDFFWIY